MRLIIFDCEGTLVDSQHTIVERITAAFKGLRYTPPTPGAIRELIGLSSEETVQRLLPGSDALAVDRLVATYQEQFIEHHRSEGSLEPLFPHGDEVLRTLHSQGYLPGVATGKSQPGLEAVLENHKLRDILSTLQTADGHPGKPHPSMLHQAMTETGVEANDTLMLGDTSFDMVMAMNTGAHPVGAVWGYHSADALRAAGARTVLGNYCDLLPCVETLWSEV